ncbi:MAG: hypothetical protein ACRBBO_05975 [Cognatishimia sp.]
MSNFLAKGYDSAPMTGGEIKTAYENQADTNAFLDKHLSKLDAAKFSYATVQAMLLDSEIDTLSTASKAVSEGDLIAAAGYDFFVRSEIGDGFLQGQNLWFEPVQIQTGGMSVVQAGAVPASVAPSDYTSEFQSALNNFGKVYLPDGNYRLDGKLTIPDNAEIVGTGLRRCKIDTYATGNAIDTTLESRSVLLQGFSLTNQAGALGTEGIVLNQSRHARLDRVQVLNYAASGSTAVVVDGRDTFAASNMIFDCLLGNNFRGLYIKADAGKQVNHTQVFGTYIYGSLGIKDIPGSVGVQVDQGDTNYFFGCAVETFDCGYRINSQDSRGAVALFVPRVEECTTKFDFDPLVANLVVFGQDTLDESHAGGGGDEASFYGAEFYGRLDKGYYKNGAYVRFKDSSGTRNELIGVTNDDILEILTPSFNASKYIRLKSRGTGDTIAEFGPGHVKLNGLPVYANDAAAGVGGLVAGEAYRTAFGELRIKI